MNDATHQWIRLYDEAVPRALHRIRQIPGVILGFHSVVDGIKRVLPSEIEAVLQDPEVDRASLEHLDGIPQEITCPSDFFRGLFMSMLSGRSFRMVIREERLFHWIMDRFGWDRLRLGGTSGCMARALAPLGIDPILVYANPPTREMMELFGCHENIWVVAQEGGKPILKHPWEAWEQEGLKALHWGFEFEKGCTVRVGPRVLSAPQGSRFYACWNPLNNRLEISEVFKRGLLARLHCFGHMIISGFQLLSSDYPDGKSCMDYIPETAAFLKQVKRKSPGIRLHLEMDTIPSSRIRKGVLDLVVPCVDSLGLNEVELDFVVHDLKGIKLGALGGTKTAAEYIQGMRSLMGAFPLQRIHFHTAGYYVCLQRHGDCSRVRDALLLAATVAACRARHGELPDPDLLYRGADLPLSREGLTEMRGLPSHIGVSATFANNGVGTIGGYGLVMVPTPHVAEPVTTVGLGDTISAVGFLAE